MPSIFSSIKIWICKIPLSKRYTTINAVEKMAGFLSVLLLPYAAPRNNPRDFCKTTEWSEILRSFLLSVGQLQLIKFACLCLSFISLFWAQLINIPSAE